MIIISFIKLNILLIIKYTVQELRVVYVLLGRNSDFNNVELVRNMLISIFYLQERRVKQNKKEMLVKHFFKVTV